MSEKVTIGNAELWLGDCLELMAAIPDGSVDMILCDLPYGTTRNKWDRPIDPLLLWPEYARLCRKAIVLTAQTPFDKVLGASNLKGLRYEWIWEKSNASGHLNAKKAPMKAHENILVFGRPSRAYNPQKTSGHARKTATADRAKKLSDNYGAQKGVTSYDSTERYPRSVIQFPMDKQKAKWHPTQKPVALMEYMIRTYTREGETVLDNCMGSGTTGVACADLGRKFIGIEIKRRHFDIACRRIEDAQRQHQLFGRQFDA